MPAPQARTALRNTYRGKRRSLSPLCQSRHAVAVAHAAAEHLATTDTVAAYYARDGEVNLAPLMEMCWRRGIRVALPVVVGRRMTFAAYDCTTTLRAGPYGIPTPAAAHAGEAAATLQPNVVLAPLVAFDDDGNRLGMGGGYYDRYFAAHPEALRVGVAHECQRAPQLPTLPTDVPLSALVTEKGWRTVPGRRP